MEAGDTGEGLRGYPLATGQQEVFVAVEALAVAVRADDPGRLRHTVTGLVLVPDHVATREVFRQIKLVLGVLRVPEQDELVAAVRARHMEQAAVAGHVAVCDLAGAKQRGGREQAYLAVVKVLGSLDALGDR